MHTVLKSLQGPCVCNIQFSLSLGMMNQLTQESLTQYGDNRGAGAVPGANTGAVPKPQPQQPQLNASFDDDLPPPPPPLSSSPTLPQRNGHHLGGAGEDTDNNSSITTDTTAQVSTGSSLVLVQWVQLPLWVLRKTDFAPIDFEEI